MFFGRTEVFRAGPAPLTLVSLGGATQQEPADDWDPWGQFLYSPKPREWSYAKWFQQITAAAGEQGYG
jgi:hypothetical protein